jgi:PAS domain S-box-containing protein
VSRPETQRPDEVTGRDEAIARAVLGAAPVLLSISSRSGKVQHVSEEWAHWSGVPSAELVGRGFLPLIHPDDVPAYMAIWNARDEQSGRIRWSLRGRDAAGTYRGIAVEGRAIRGDDGAIEGWVMVARPDEDAGPDLNVLASVAVGVPSMIWVADAAGTTSWISPMWSRFTGIAEPELLGGGLAATIHPEDAAPVQARWQAGIEDGRAFEIEYRVRRHDGTYRWHLTRAVAQIEADARVGRWIGTTNDIDDQKRMYEREHEVADALQRALLPGYLPDLPGLTFDAAYRPATLGMLVGGDYYDAFTLGDGTVCVSIGDVSGHGLDAAAAMGKMREAIRVAVFAEGRRPDVVLRRANRALFLGAPGMLVTAIFGVIDARTHEFSYASAGHPPPLVASRRGVVRMLDGGGLPLGVDEEFHPAMRTARLEPGDSLVLYTDGLVENERDLLRGEQSLLATLQAQQYLRAEHPADAIVDELVRGPQRDDIAVLVVGVEGRPRAEFDQLFAAVGPSAAAARRALREFLVLDHIAKARIDDALTAAGEAVANAIEHAYERVPGTFRLRAATYDDHVVVEVEDDGRWRTPRTPPPSGDAVGRIAERGRGLFIVRALTEHAVVDRTPAGTRVRFVVLR